MTVKKDVRLKDLVSEKLVDLDLEETNKKKLIGELVEMVSKSPKIKDKKVFFKAVLDRENLGSTGIGNGAAIPHAKSDKVSGFVVGFARNSLGVDFGALDGEKTMIFFILAAPKDDPENHLKILAEISRVVRDKFIVEKLKTAKSKKEIIDILETYSV